MSVCKYDNHDDLHEMIYKLCKLEHSNDYSADKEDHTGQESGDYSGSYSHDGYQQKDSEHSKSEYSSDNDFDWSDYDLDKYVHDGDDHYGHKNHDGDRDHGDYDDHEGHEKWHEHDHEQKYCGCKGDQSVVPVPAAVWLFASGLIGLLAVSRRKPG
jgi:hypothetical protein